MIYEACHNIFSIKERVGYWITAAWCGGAVISFELAGARLMLPTFGSGIEVWAIVISLTLGALAIGYGLGGKLADARPGLASLGWVIIASAVSLVVIHLVGRWAIVRLEHLGFIAGTWLSATVLFGPTMVFLGMVQPVLARLMIKDAKRSGKIVGGLLAVSTAGSMVGAVLTGLVLIPQVGIAMTILSLAIGTAVLGVLTLVVARLFRGAVTGTFFFVALGIIVAWVNARNLKQRPEHIVESVEGIYGDLEVLEHSGSLSLICNGIFQTTMPMSGVATARGNLIRGRDYIELIPYLRPQTRSALLIGLGGGLHAQALARYGIEIQCVEIDPAVVQLAAKHFKLSFEVMVADGRVFLRHDTRRYDTIILDVFLGSSLPEHLFTKEAFELMEQRLMNNGLLAIHIVGRPSSLAVRAIARTIEAVFSHLVAVRSGFGNELQQIYLFAALSPLELHRLSELEQFGFTGKELFNIDTQGASVLTDNRTCLGLLNGATMVEMHRQSQNERKHLLW